MSEKVERIQVRFRELELQCFWHPAQCLCAFDCDQLSATVHLINDGRGSVDYGFFDPRWSRSQRTSFLARSSWCIVYKGGSPCGFAYTYDLGDVSSTRVIHQGLVKLNRRVGRDTLLLIYLCLAWGNIRNCGRFVATSISHIPLIIDLFDQNMLDSWPRLRGGAPPISEPYKAALRLLTDEYIYPVLEYSPASMSLGGFRIGGALAEKQHGFETRWRILPKSGCPDVDDRIAALLGVDAERRDAIIGNDLIQVGICGRSCLTKEHNLQLLEEAGVPLADVYGQPVG